MSDIRWWKEDGTTKCYIPPTGWAQGVTLEFRPNMVTRHVFDDGHEARASRGEHIFRPVAKPA